MNKLKTLNPLIKQKAEKKAEIWERVIALRDEIDQKDDEITKIKDVIKHTQQEIPSYLIKMNEIGEEDLINSQKEVLLNHDVTSLMN